jgi:hypothetical protein
MKISQPHNKLKHLAIAVSVVFGLAACSSDSDDPIVIPPPPPPPVNVAPVVSSAAVTSAEEGVAYTYTLTATDADANDTLVLASVTLPAWLTFDITSGELSGTPAAADVGDNAVSLTVTDGTDTVTQDFTIAVTAAPFVNTAPVFSSTALTAATEDTVYSYTATATDADVNDTLVLASVTLPSWLTFDVTSGVLSGTPAAADVGNNAVSLTVTDGTDTATQDFTIAVTAAPFVNTAPTFTSTGLAMGTVGTVYSYTATASDVDVDDTLSFDSVTLPSWATFNTDTAVLLGTPDMAGDYPVELSVTDGTDSASQTFTIVVPEASTTTVDLVVFENAVLPEWAAWDCCSGGTQVLVTDDAEHDQAVEFSILGAAVVGFSARESDGAVGGTPFDASAIVDGMITFELKMTNAPDAGVVDWKLKLEGPGSAGEVNLSTSVEGHTTPILDTWQTYTFPISDLVAAGQDASAIHLFMVFPNFDQAGGAVFRLDNVKIISTTGTPDPDPEPAVVALSVFDNAVLPEWAAWDCCSGGTQVLVTDDAEHDQAVEFSILGAAVVGFSARESDGAVGGTPFDASAIADTGTIAFDLKMTKAPDAGVVDWKLKLEGPGSAGEVNLSTSIEGHATPLLDTWQTYTFPISDLVAAGQDASAIHLFMVFPNFDQAGGAVFLLDKVAVYESGASTGGGDTGGDPEVVSGVENTADFGEVLNGGFENGLADWQAGAGASIVTPNSGSNMVKIVVGNGGNENIFQAGIGEGVFTPGQALTVSFQMRGTAGPGGVVSGLLYTDNVGGEPAVTKTEELLPLALNADWTPYTFNVIAGSPIASGVSIRLAAVCGAVAGCTVEAYFDNIKIAPTTD